MKQQILELRPRFRSIFLCFKTDELSFTVPYEMFAEMLNRFEGSFLKTETWPTVQKKIARSKRTWGES